MPGESRETKPPEVTDLSELSRRFTDELDAQFRAAGDLDHVVHLTDDETTQVAGEVVDEK